MGMVSGKRALIVGIASKLSSAYGIAEAMHREGAELAFTYQNEKLKNRVLGFAGSWGIRGSLHGLQDTARGWGLQGLGLPELSWG